MNARIMRVWTADLGVLVVHAHLDVPLSNSVFVQWSEPAESCQVYVVRRFEMHAEAAS